MLHRNYLEFNKNLQEMYIEKRRKHQKRQTEVAEDDELDIDEEGKEEEDLRYVTKAENSIIYLFYRCEPLDTPDI